MLPVRFCQSQSGRREVDCKMLATKDRIYNGDIRVLGIVEVELTADKSWYIPYLLLMSRVQAFARHYRWKRTV